MSAFDETALLYSSSVPPIPDQYIKLIAKNFGLSPLSTILDLGCGAGTLTFALLKLSQTIKGIDESSEMIKLAKQRDINALINWVCTPVNNFEFGREQLDLIISFEAFHLFPNPEELISKCSKALKPAGFISIGWVNFEWEEPLREVIWDVCTKYGISFSDWGYWTCPDFPNHIRSSQDLGEVIQKSTLVPAKSKVQDIVDHMVSIEKASTLTKNEREQLASELTSAIDKVYPTGFSDGMAKYTIAYSQKRNLL
jgi:SAM-dependent methyltransferase